MEIDIEGKGIIETFYSAKKYPKEWHMVPSERAVVESFLRMLRPNIAIEIGTFKGGSLQVMSRFCEKVYSVDINSEIESLSSSFDNVEFEIGDSKKILPGLLEEIELKNEVLSFILIDGDHSTAGVRGDIELFMEWKPSVPTVIVLHDSFNPSCRKGMLEANWEKSPWVHKIELDYVCGQVIPYQDSPAKGEMWGGLAVVLMLPEKRTCDLKITQLYQYNYEYAEDCVGRKDKMFKKIAKKFYQFWK